MKCRRSILSRSSALCGRSGFTLFAAPRSSAPCHNGSGTRIFLPLRKPRNRPTPARGTSLGFPVLRLLPQRQRNRHFPAVAEAPEPTDPCERCFPGHPGPPPLATTAAEPVFSCRCGSPGTGRPLRQALPGPSWSSAPCHNGSGTRIFLPLWKPRNRPTPATGTSRAILVLRPLPQRQRNPYFPAVAEIQKLFILSLYILGVWQYA